MPRRRPTGPIQEGPFAGLEHGGFPCILADPPWHHATRTKKGINSRHPSAHYPTMPLAEIKALPVHQLAARDCHLWLWSTGPHLQQAFGVMEAWGFRYSSDALIWLKLNPRAADKIFLEERDIHVGPGFTTRKNIEYCLLGRRGSPKRLHKGIRQVIVAARRQHSRKPDQAFPRIEAYCPGPRLELFSREPREGWAAWGNQTDRFSPPVEPNESYGPPYPWPETPLLEAVP